MLAKSLAVALRGPRVARPPQGDGICSGDDAHDVGFLHDQELVAVELDLGAGPFAEQHAVAGFDVDRDELAVVVTAAGTYRHDLALLRLFLHGIGNDDAALGLRLGIDTLDDHAVVQRPEFHFRHVYPLKAAALQRPCGNSFSFARTLQSSG